MAEKFLLTRHKTDISEIIHDEDDKKHYAVNINFVELFDNDPELGSNLLKDPEQALCYLENEIYNAQELLIEQNAESTRPSLKLNIHARIYGLPLCPELNRTKVPRNADSDLLLQICGTVLRVTGTKMLEYQRPYTCKKCKHIEMVEADYDFKYCITPPQKCANCGGTNMMNTGVLNPDNCKDYQEIKLQEKASEVGVGSLPAALWVTLEDDLVDTCKPGDDVIICGIVKARHGPLIVGSRIYAEIVLQANHIHITNGYTAPKLVTYEVKEKFALFWEKYKDRPIEGRDMILKSFCPKLYGMYIVKLAVAIVLAGGSRCKEGNEVGIRIRSESHLLLVGDPGTGKSQLLRYAAKVVPRAVLTTGVGTTSAGLTAAAMMEDGHWQLEGGALVLADGGICCIDEFNSMKPHDRTSIHEAMEQQTISIAKVGRVSKLQTRCTILAATNPKGGRLDPSQKLSLNLTLPSPLLSRFDVVMMLRDVYDETWDSLIADFILSDKDVEAKTIEDNFWNLETLQHYFMVIKDINPVLTTVANKILSGYYQAQRRAETRNKARSTVRLLDSLIRLSQAHAKFMCHSEVQIMDALYAVVLIETSMDGECSILLDKINVTAPFVDNPNENYIQIATTILQKLGLIEILNAEITAYNNDYQQPVLHIEIEQQESTQNAADNSRNSDESDGGDNNEPNNSKTTEPRNVEFPRRTTALKENYGLIKKPKLHKQCKHQELNDVEMLNLIPSVIDDFDTNILNDLVVVDDKCVDQIIKTQNVSQEKGENNIIPRHTDSISNHNSSTENENKSTDLDSSIGDVTAQRKLSIEIMKNESLKNVNKSNRNITLTKRAKIKASLSSFHFKFKNPPQESVTKVTNIVGNSHSSIVEDANIDNQTPNTKPILAENPFESLEPYDDCFDF